MNEAMRQMLLIKSLDNSASILLSEYTNGWYVNADIEIGDGVILSGVTEHCDSPEPAVDAFFYDITHLSLDQYLVTTYAGQRREWNWNGAAFVERTREAARVPLPLNPPKEN